MSKEAILIGDQPQNQRLIQKLLGVPIKGGITGSRRMFVEEASVGIAPDFKFPVDKSQVSIQKYERGILLRFIYATQQAFYPLSFEHITSFRLTGGEETITPRRFSRFWFMLKMGIPVRVARIILPVGRSNL